MIIRPQAVADAYYVLSDPQRRSDYDRLSSSKSSSERTNDPNASNNFFRMFSSMFTTNSAAGNGPSGAVPEQPDQRPDADQVFGDVFEDVRHPHFFRIATTAHPPLFSFRYTQLNLASTARGRAAFPVVDMVGCSMRCWSRVYHCQHARPRRWCVCGQSTRGHSGCKGQERGCRFLRVGCAAESRGTRNTFLGSRALFSDLTTVPPCSQILRALALKVLGVAYT